MSFLNFFIPYFLHLLLGALFICGFYAITRGNIETLPDGSKKRNGKIFMGWYFFWYREWPEPKKIYYRGVEFDKLFIQINNSTSNKLMPIRYTPISIEVIGDCLNTTWKQEIEMRFDIKIEEKKHEGNTIVHFLKEYPHYVFPWWVRDMMAGCITCHSSWLGSICFWFPVLLSSGWVLEPMYAFTIHETIALVATWMAYCISLAFITTGLWKKYMV